MYKFGPKDPRARYQVLAPVDVSSCPAYRSATPIYVRNGRGDFCRKGNSDCYRVEVNDDPFVEIANANGKHHIKPLLSRQESERSVVGYISTLLKRTGEASTPTYIEIIAPLLACLENGYYMILDTMLYPASGNKDHFMQVQGQTALDALQNLSHGKKRPAYLFPTSLPTKMAAQEKSPIRQAVCYYLQGSLSLLLVGHDLAMEAALLGSYLPALVIVPCTACTDQGAWFADLFVDRKVFYSPPAAMVVQPKKLTDKRAVISKSDHCEVPLAYRALWKQYPLAKDGEVIKLLPSRETAPMVSFEQALHTDQHEHYSELALVRVQNGTGQFVQHGDSSFYKLSLGESDLAQIYDFYSDSGLTHIAPAYGNAESNPHLRQSVENISQIQGGGIEAYAKALIPLLAQLPDGLYVIADMLLYPSTGERFFWNVPNHPTPMKALDDPDLGFAHPAYIYPTLNPAFYNPTLEEIAKCTAQLESGQPHRAICYYLRGYMSALLYGHTIAAMAAALTRELPALVIIPYCDMVASNSSQTLARFADIILPAAPELLPEQTIRKDNACFRREPKIQKLKDWDEFILHSWKAFPPVHQLIFQKEQQYRRNILLSPPA